MEYSRLTVQALCAGDQRPFYGKHPIRICAGDVREALRRGANRTILLAILHMHARDLTKLISYDRPKPHRVPDDIYIEA